MGNCRNVAETLTMREIDTRERLMIINQLAKELVTVQNEMQLCAYQLLPHNWCFEFLCSYHTLNLSHWHLLVTTILDRRILGDAIVSLGIYLVVLSSWFGNNSNSQVSLTSLIFLSSFYSSRCIFLAPLLPEMPILLLDFFGYLIISLVTLLRSELPSYLLKLSGIYLYFAYHSDSLYSHIFQIVECTLTHKTMGSAYLDSFLYKILEDHVMRHPEYNTTAV